MNVDELYMDRDSQIDAIEKTFRDAQREITQHYSKPHVHPVEILPVMPDNEMWKYPCAQVIFDSDPAPAGVPPAQQNEQMGQAMIRGGEHYCQVINDLARKYTTSLSQILSKTRFAVDSEAFFGLL